MENKNSLHVDYETVYFYGENPFANGSRKAPPIYVPIEVSKETFDRVKLRVTKDFLNFSEGEEGNYSFEDFSLKLNERDIHIKFKVFGP